MKRYFTFKKFYKIERSYGFSLPTATRHAYSRTIQVEDHHKEISLRYNITGGSWLLNYAIQKRIDSINNKNDHEFEKIFRKRVNHVVMSKRTEDISKLGQRIQDLGLDMIKDEDPNSQKTVWEILLDKFMRKSKEVGLEAKKQMANKDQQQKFMDGMLEYTKLYHESVQGLLEGQREVVRDEDFKFEDGRTVRDKTKAFENFLRSKMPKFSLKHKLKIPSGISGEQQENQ